MVFNIYEAHGQRRHVLKDVEHIQSKFNSFLDV